MVTGALQLLTWGSALTFQIGLSHKKKLRKVSLVLHRTKALSEPASKIYVTWTARRVNADSAFYPVKSENLGLQRGSPEIPHLLLFLLVTYSGKESQYARTIQMDAGDRTSPHFPFSQIRTMCSPGHCLSLADSHHYPSSPRFQPGPSGSSQVEREDTALSLFTPSI